MPESQPFGEITHGRFRRGGWTILSDLCDWLRAFGVRHRSRFGRPALVCGRPTVGRRLSTLRSMKPEQSPTSAGYDTWPIATPSSARRMFLGAGSSVFASELTDSTQRTRLPSQLSAQTHRQTLILLQGTNSTVWQSWFVRSAQKR